MAKKKKAKGVRQSVWDRASAAQRRKWLSQDREDAARIAKRNIEK